MYIFSKYKKAFIVKIGTTCYGRSTVARRRAPPVTIAEPLRTAAHHFSPKLPPLAMLATFATFAVASRNFLPRRAHGLRTPLQQRPTRQLTHLVLVASMLQQHLSCIRPQRLYKPALRPSQLDRSEYCKTLQNTTESSADNSITLPLNVLSPKVYHKTLTGIVYYRLARALFKSLK